MQNRQDLWPDVPFEEWATTLEKLHLWTQIVGKIRMQHDAWVNHSWGVVLHVSPRGLRTPLVPNGASGFDMTLDLHEHALVIDTTSGDRATIALDDRSIADFYAEVLSATRAIGIEVDINSLPSEIADAVRFDDDHRRLGYEPDHARAFHHVLVHVERVMTRFRADYLGKASPVNFFWGSFDLAVARFSGRDAPAHPGGLPNFPVEVAREAYSHELTSAGFYPGNRDAPEPFFYSYAYPAPDGFEDADPGPDAACFDTDLGEFVLPYSAVVNANDPDEMVLDFYRSVHDAAADLADWDRDLECRDPRGPDWWRQRPHDTSVV